MRSRFVFAHIHSDNVPCCRTCNKLLMNVGAYLQGNELVAEESDAVDLAAHTDFYTMDKLVAVDKEVLAAVADENEAES